jgi:hypothetical protein
MNSSLSAGPAIVPVTGVDFSAALGKAVKFTAGVPAVNNSATVPAIAIVLEGNVAAKVSTLGILGGLDGAVRVKIAADAAALKFGDSIQQKNDGTWTNDAGAGNARCVGGVIANPDGAVAGQLVEAVVFAPQIRA